MGYPELPPYYSLKPEISTGTGGSGRGTVAVTGRISARACTTALRLVENRLTEKSNRLYGAEGILLSGDNSRKKRGGIACGAETIICTETEASPQYLSFPFLCPFHNVQNECTQPVFLRAHIALSLSAVNDESSL